MPESTLSPNWVGAAEICRSKADPFSGPRTAPEVLAWAHLAIAIDESIATTRPDWREAFVGSAMSTRTNMIVRFGDHPKDRICDMDKVVTFYLSLPAVEKLLSMEQFPEYILCVDSDARVAAEELRALRDAKRLIPTGQVEKLLDIVAHAEGRGVPPPDHPFYKKLRVKSVEGPFLK